MINHKYRLGIDIGSKTIKVVILDTNNETLFDFYDHHLTDVKKMLLQALSKAFLYVKDSPVTIGVTGSAGIRFAELCSLPFIQEVLSAKTALGVFAPSTDVAIELGGEDSKIIFLTGGEDLRMNDTCAGGTGGFIDTIAGMFDLRADRFNSLALGATTIYPIASRCAVFAMSDVRPLFNEGAKKEDIAASTFAAVATQCITGLAGGREIAGNITLLGGPFHFLTGLRNAFRQQLSNPKNKFLVPPEAHLFVAKGAALYGEKEAALINIPDIVAKLEASNWSAQDSSSALPQLFVDSAEYETFRAQHNAHHPKYGAYNGYRGQAYLGIDSGSTTLKCVLIGEDNEILFKYYERVAGNLIDSATEMFKNLYKQMPNRFDGSPDVEIAQSCVCGYGEDYFLSAFKVDSSEVETVCHTKAASYFVPDVDTILDIGGQDIKYIKVCNQSLDDIVLNEACSSGCGSLIGGFAYSMNYKIEDFAKIALFASSPVDLGTRCTVFMTSRVRHAQKEGASASDIAAGLAYSVVRNALYKVIRLSDTNSIGKNIVVTGGTFKNDAVLRAFENITGREVYRNVDSEFMGAYGAALIAKERAANKSQHAGRVLPHQGASRKAAALPQKRDKTPQGSTILSLSEVVNLRQTSSTRHCELCGNKCLLTVTEFYDAAGELPDYVIYAGSGGKVANYRAGGSAQRLNEQKTDVRYLIAGNRCSKPIDTNRQAGTQETFDLYQWTYKRLFNYKSLPEGSSPRGIIGIPRVLNFYNDYPFWHAFLTELGFRVVLSGESSREMYLQAAQTILSESACYPAKLVNAHIIDLLKNGVENIFFPTFEYSQNGRLNCSLVTNWPLVVSLNLKKLIAPRITTRDDSVPQLLDAFSNFAVSEEEINAAFKAGQEKYQSFYQLAAIKGAKTVKLLRDKGLKGVVIGGRSYHLDPEINHGLPEVLRSFGLSVLTPESVVYLGSNDPELFVEDFWEYPSLVYRAAKVTGEIANLEFLHTYSFGCGHDALTTDQAKKIVEANHRLYTSLKIDEMSDLAATKIRMRSMIAALDKPRLKNKTIVKSCRTEQYNPSDYDRVIIASVYLPESEALAACFANAEVVRIDDRQAVLTGMANVNNDACYCTIFLVGQIIDYLNTLPPKKEKLLVVLPIYCVKCRALDLRAILKEAISKYIDGEYVDVTYAYEVSEFLDVDNAHTFAEKLVATDVAVYKASVNSDRPLGVAGNSPIIFNDTINNNLYYEAQNNGCTLIYPNYTDYLIYHGVSQNLTRALNEERSKHTEVFKTMESYAAMSQDFGVNTDYRNGAGWLYVGQVLDLCAKGVHNIVYAHSFGCLPAHTIGRGIIKKIRTEEGANLVSIEFDPGSSSVNQSNRIRLLTSQIMSK